MVKQCIWKQVWKSSYKDTSFKKWLELRHKQIILKIKPSQILKINHLRKLNVPREI